MSASLQRSRWAVSPQEAGQLLAVALLALSCLHCSRRPEPLAGDLRPLVRQGDTLALSLKLDEHPRLLHKQFRSTDGMLHQFTLLHMAAMEGQPKVADLLLARGADPNVRSGADGLTPLHVAVVRADLQLAQVLLDGGADPGAGDAEQTPPLHYALVLGHREAARYLLANGAEHDAYSAAAMGDVEALEEALTRNPQVVTQWRNPFGTPLHWAAALGTRDAAALLVDNGAEVSATRPDGDAAADLPSIFEILPKEAREGLERRSETEMEALRYAMPALFESPTSRRPTPLHLAAEKGNAPVADLLISRKAELEARDGAGRTALHRAVAAGHPDLARMLLAAGAEPNASDALGATPLHRAAEESSVAMVRLLLQHGANADARDEQLRSPLAYAPSGADQVRAILRSAGARLGRPDWAELQTAAANGDLETVGRLLQKGVKLEAKDKLGRTSLLLAVANGHHQVAERLLEAGADPNVVAARRWTPLLEAAQAGDSETMELLLDYGAEPDLSIGRRTVLQIMAQSSKVRVCRVLLEHGADPMARGIGSRTPLHVAAAHGQAEMAKLLLEFGHPVDAYGGVFYETPLQVAARLGWPRLVELLLEEGADVNARDGDGAGQTALDWTYHPDARSRRRIRSILRKHGGQRGADLE